MSQAVAGFRRPFLDADGEAVLAAQADAEAFAVLYERYATRVYRYLRPRASNDQEAADITQQVFLKAMTSLHRFRPSRAPFSAWLFRIARNVATDAYRRRRPTLSLSAAAALESGDDPEEAAVRADRIRRLEAQLARLNEASRELLALRFGASLSSREIAAVVGKSEAAVKKQLTRIISSLKEHYRE
jgi:RNA polymerase sigma-70 factor (ECF subfamily)